MNRPASVSILSRDPHFCMASQLLLGRYTNTRVVSLASSPAFLGHQLRKKHIKLQTIVCDVDSLKISRDFTEELHQLSIEWPTVNLLWVGIDPLKSLSTINLALPIRAVLSKSELGYCIHLAVQAAQEQNCVWATYGLVSKLSRLSIDSSERGVIVEETLHPMLSARIYEVFFLRVVIGLDNKDIQDELGIEYNTVREYVSQAYKAFGVHNELQAFQALSEWWWTTRFLRKSE
jgi:DNA-binding NarL/FixJ family response regulator